MSLSSRGLEEKSFNDLSESIGESEKILIETRILMYRFLSEIDKITEERKINRKELAKLAGTSASYVTQLYQGKKIINLQMLTRIKKALNIDFKIEIVQHDEKIKKDYRKLSSKHPDFTKLRRVVFWDTKMENINWEKQKNAVIKRVFERGNEIEKKEIMRFYGRKNVTNLLKTNGK